MFESLFKKHDPNSQESYGILKFFAEDLNDEQLLEFVNHLEIKGSILLLSEIGFISQNNSVRLKIFSILEIKLNKWIFSEINFNNNLLTNRPRLIESKKQEFINYILSYNKIGFPKEIEFLFKEFIFNSHTFLCGKYFESAFRSLFSSTTIEFIKAFGVFLLSLTKDKNNFINVNQTIYFYFNELAFSRFIFEIDTVLLDAIIEFRDELLESRTSEKFSIKNLLLTEIIIKKELDFDKIQYGERINNLLKGLTHDFESLDLLYFLERFNYNFKDYRFSLQIKKVLLALDFRQEESNEQNLSRLSYIDSLINNSNLICDYIIFHIKYLPNENKINQIEVIISQFKKIKLEFINLIGFNEYNKFIKIEGEKVRINKIISNGKSIPKGHKIKIINAQIVANSSSHGSFIRENCFNPNFENRQVEYGFLSPIFSKNKKYYSDSSEKINVLKPNMEFFQIASTNYTPLNKGQVFRVMPFSKDLEQLSFIFGIDNLFGKFDLWILDQTLNIFKSNVKILGISLRSINNHFRFEFGVSDKINSDINDFRKFIKLNYPDLFREVIVKIEIEKDSFIELKGLFKSNETVKGIITNRVKGGGGYNVLYKNLNGFLPGSLLDLSCFDNSHKSEKIINSEIDFKIDSIDEEQNSFIVSHKAATKQEKLNKIEKVYDILEKGLIVEGFVKNITDYGAFVDIGGIDGLIHISDLSWGRVNHPREIVELNQKINVVILDFDHEKKRIALGFKQLLPDPWANIEGKYSVASKHNVKVRNLTNFGVFVELEKGVDGLIHISDLSRQKKYEHPSEFCKTGDDIQVLVLEIDHENRIISLGHKQLKENPWDIFKATFTDGSIHQGTIIKTKGLGLTGIVSLPFGFEGICPEQHMNKVDGSKAQVDETLAFKVLEYKKESMKIIVSHTRTFEEEENRPSSTVKPSETAKKSIAPKKVAASSSDQIVNQIKTTFGAFDVLSELKKKMEKGEENNGIDKQ